MTSVYFSLSEAFVALKKKKAFARALSPNFVLAPHPQTKDFLIFYNKIPVAELVSKTNIKILVKEFRNDCCEFFNIEGIKIV